VAVGQLVQSVPDRGAILMALWLPVRLGHSVVGVFNRRADEVFVGVPAQVHDAWVATEAARAGRSVISEEITPVQSKSKSKASPVHLPPSVRISGFGLRIWVRRRRKFLSLSQ